MDETTGAVIIQLDTGEPSVDDECRRVLMDEIDWIDELRIESPAQESTQDIPGVAHVLLVTSCKGGVGKSTVAANLACVLAQQGHRVGLADLDVFGPSLPTLMPHIAGPLKYNDAETHLLPLTTPAVLRPKPSVSLRFGLFRQRNIVPSIKIISAGWLRAGFTAVRAPIACEIVLKLLTATDWGELDYLVVDMPPGTGDLQLTVRDLVPNASFVLVTTPSDLSLVDAFKGSEMFEELGIPCVGIVLNEIAQNVTFVWDGTQFRRREAADEVASSLLPENVPICHLRAAEELACLRFETASHGVCGPLGLVDPQNAHLEPLRRFGQEVTRQVARASPAPPTAPPAKPPAVEASLDNDFDW